MDDTKLLKEFNCLKCPHILVFITSAKTPRRLSTKPEAPTEQIDFELFRDNFGFTDEEMNWKRFCFHGAYSLGAHIYQINDNNLVIREAEFLVNNSDTKSNPEKFKRMSFHDLKLFDELDKTFIGMAFF